jgi:hypothetical protein
MLKTELGAARLASAICVAFPRSAPSHDGPHKQKASRRMSMSSFVESGQSDRNKTVLGVAEAPYWPALIVSFGLLAPLAWNLSLVWICGRTIGVW